MANKFPLAEINAVPEPADKFERYCEELAGLSDTTAASVYVVKKIVGKRIRNEVTEYQCTWQGFSKNHKTWQPASYLIDYGAAEIVKDYEKSLHHTVMVAKIMQSDEMIAVLHDMEKYKLPGSVQQWVEAYKLERTEIRGSRIRQLSKAEVKELKSRGTKAVSYTHLTLPTICSV